MFIKLKEWFWRYLPAEIFAIIGALVVGTLANMIFHNPVVTALLASLGENTGFYGKILYQDIQTRRKKDQKITLRGMLKVLRNAVTEFGVAEYLDQVIRPFAMYIFPQFLGNVTLGILVGKFAADITFYVPVIFFYEIRKKVFKD